MYTNCCFCFVLTFRTILVHSMFCRCCELLKKIYLYRKKRKIITKSSQRFHISFMDPQTTWQPDAGVFNVWSIFKRVGRFDCSQRKSWTFQAKYCQGRRRRGPSLNLFYSGLTYCPQYLCFTVIGHVPKYSTTDHWIQESIKRIFNSGLFWAVRAGEKKIQTAISMLLLRTKKKRLEFFQ